LGKVDGYQQKRNKVSENMNPEQCFQRFGIFAFQNLICRCEKSYEKSSNPTKPMSKTEGTNQKVQLKPTRVCSNRKGDSRYYYRCGYPKIYVSQIFQTRYFTFYSHLEFYRFPISLFPSAGKPW
jgi:hypothetical protein